jgi:hypothetical protein
MHIYTQYIGIQILSLSKICGVVMNFFFIFSILSCTGTNFCVLMRKSLKNLWAYFHFASLLNVLLFTHSPDALNYFRRILRRVLAKENSSYSTLQFNALIFFKRLLLCLFNFVRNRKRSLTAVLKSISAKL